MLKSLARLWRLLTHPPLPPDPQPRPLSLEFVCRACGHPFEQQVQRLEVDLSAARRYQGQNRSSLAPEEATIPEQIVCPRCWAVDQYEIAASAYGPLGAALLRARFGAYSPDEPIQFINLTAESANLNPASRSPKRRPPRR